METTMQDTIERQITVRATKERVFNAISDPKQVVKWFPDSVDGGMNVGDSPLLDFGSDGKCRIVVTASDPYSYFAYRWSSHAGGAPNYDVDVLNIPNTLVEFRIEETNTGTTVTVKESGFANLTADIRDKAFSDNSGGWEYMLGRLETFMATE